MDGVLLEMSNISKTFSGVKALTDVSFNLYPGEVHVLVGENGAGKSTLMKIIAGVHQANSGQLMVNGKNVKFGSTTESQDAGISIIHQELSLMNTLSISANIFLRRELMVGPILNKRLMNNKARDALRRVGLELDPRTRVGRLSMAQKQLVEIAKALSLNAKVIIMDEPTSSLTNSEKRNLFEIIARLRQEGVGIIYISHDLDDVFNVADRITVLRDGKTVFSCRSAETDKDTIIYNMVGRELNEIYDYKCNVKPEVLLHVEGLSKKGLLEDISFSVQAGEIVGVAGLMGAGRTELAYHLYGLMKPDSGTIQLNGKQVTIASPSHAMELGIGLVPEDRKEMGLFLNMTIQSNASMSSLQSVLRYGLVDSKAERKKVLQYIKDFNIRSSGPQQKVVNLSGGNQQKVVLARTMSTDPILLIFDEPTRGVDVGAKAEIYKLMHRLAASGVGIIMISSELQEILGVCDRILIMRNGRIAGELPREEATSESIMQFATGQAVVS